MPCELNSFSLYSRHQTTNLSPKISIIEVEHKYQDGRASNMHQRLVCISRDPSNPCTNKFLHFHTRQKCTIKRPFHHLTSHTA